MITLAADVGGTFTDLVLVDTGKGTVHIDKVPTGRRGRPWTRSRSIPRH